MVTEQQIQSVIDAYEKGASQKDAASAGNMALQTAVKWLKERGAFKSSRSTYRKVADVSEEQRDEIVALYRERRSPVKIEQLTGASQWTIYSALRKQGVLRHHKNGGGPGNKATVGSTFIRDGGYIVEKVPDDWPFLGSVSGFGDGTWISQHRKVMVESLNRALLPGEQVHHIDGDRDDYP